MDEKILDDIKAHYFSEIDAAIERLRSRDEAERLDPIMKVKRQIKETNHMMALLAKKLARLHKELRVLGG